jgi:hypothetical protein
MAVEEFRPNGHERSLSTEKHDIERVENVSDTYTPEILQNNEGEAVSITWKTWAVIFVSCFLSCVYL